jgi:pSer/pThr/pTyr-binding forkhead associated (FHA) protein
MTGQPQANAAMPNQSRVSMPPPLPPGGRSTSQSAMQAARSMLYVIFNGQKIPVAKDEFIIGRGSKSADLAIKDGNISRRHAAVVFHNGAYYMKDLGSTNGIEYQGRRFDTKRIDEGDAFRICDYEIRFTYS